MEGTQGQLGTRLADGLGGDHADHLALLDHAAGGQVAAVAFRADALLRFAGQHRTDLHLLNREALDEVGEVFGDLVAGAEDLLAGERIVDVVDRGTAEDALAERLDDLVLVLDRGGDQAAQRAAVFLGDDDVVGDVHQAAGQVTGVRRLEGGVGQTLTGAVRGDEVLEHGHP